MILQQIRNTLRGVLQTYGSSKVKKRLWDAQFARGRWDCLETSPGDCVYSRIEKAANGGSILDLGCGSGSTANELDASKYHDYTGVDISDVAIEKARQKTEENGRGEKSRFYQSDIIKYEPTQRFDVIVFRDSIYYLDPAKIPATLGRYSKWLKEGGVFVIRMWSGQGKSAKVVEIIETHLQIIEKYWPDEAGPLVFVCRCQR